VSWCCIRILIRRRRCWGLGGDLCRQTKRAQLNMLSGKSKIFTFHCLYRGRCDSDHPCRRSSPHRLFRVRRNHPAPLADHPGRAPTITGYGMLCSPRSLGPGFPANNGMWSRVQRIKSLVEKIEVLQRSRSYSSYNDHSGQYFGLLKSLG